MIENHEKIHCHISPGTIQGGNCPETCPGRLFNATIESAVAHTSAESGASFTYNNERKIWRFYKILFKNKPLPDCKVNRRNSTC